MSGILSKHLSIRSLGVNLPPLGPIHIDKDVSVINDVFDRFHTSIGLTSLCMDASKCMVENDPFKMIKYEKTPASELVVEPSDYELIDINNIDELPNEYPDEFNELCLANGLQPPNINTGNGKALSVLLKYKYCYWNRVVCDKFVEKFNIKTKDSIQLFNKHNQWGIQTNSGTERGKLYIVYPYRLSNKHKMRKNFNFDGTVEEQNTEIDKIKSTIKTDYIDIPNVQWQLGHKNPGSTDNSTNNLVLQPPIQGKYRDNYIFIDPITKFPMPNKLEIMIEKKEIEFTQDQITSYKAIFDKLFTSI
jgi:hypothetical protein